MLCAYVYCKVFTLYGTIQFISFVDKKTLKIFMSSKNTSNFIEYEGSQSSQSQHDSQAKKDNCTNTNSPSRRLSNLSQALFSPSNKQLEKVDSNSTVNTPQHTQSMPNAQDVSAMATYNIIQPIEVSSGSSSDSSNQSQAMRTSINTLLNTSTANTNARPQDRIDSILKGLQQKQYTSNRDEQNCPSLTRARLKPNQIGKRLSNVTTYMDYLVIKHPNAKRNFNMFMAFCQKQYIKENIPVNTQVTIHSHANESLETSLKSVENAKTIDILRSLVGPSPYSTNAVRHKPGMVSLTSVHPVSSTSTTNSKLFYCILNSNTSITKYSIISYVSSTSIQENGTIFYMNLKKYTDRRCLRTALYSYNFDDITTELYCFILENIHMFSFDPMYIKQTDSYVILDLYALVSNIMYFYTENGGGNMLDLQVLNIFRSENKSLYQNELLPDIAINTRLGYVNNSNTFVFAFWKYELNILQIKYYDDTWFSNEVPNFPITSLETNLDAQCFYSITASNWTATGCTNTCTLDTDMTLSWKEPQESVTPMVSDDVKGYMKRHPESMQALTNYLNELGSIGMDSTFKGFYYTLACVLPLIFANTTGDGSYVSTYIGHLRDLKQQHLGDFWNLAYAAVCNNLPDYTSHQTERRDENTVLPSALEGASLLIL